MDLCAFHPAGNRAINKKDLFCHLEAFGAKCVIITFKCPGGGGQVRCYRQLTTGIVFSKYPAVI